MQLSLVICSRDRAAQLQRSLAKLNLDAMARLAVDLVLVDSASSDDTHDVMARFAQSAAISVRVIREDRPGASIARNVGARAARGDHLIFTDDDCYLGPDYFDVMDREFRLGEFQYGGGHTVLYDESDENVGVTDLNVLARNVVLQPRSLLLPGIIQGANMFFQRAAFDRLGGFDERLGAGTPFPSEDIELCTRASQAGYVGVLLKDAKVWHHHGRKSGSAELMAAVHGYDRGRGAYYALLMARGHKHTMELWSKGPHLQRRGPMTPVELNILKNEMRGAADYLEMILDQAGRLPPHNPV